MTRLCCCYVLSLNNPAHLVLPFFSLYKQAPVNTGRKSWLCFKVPDFTCVGNCTSYAEFTGAWPSETFLLMLYCELQLMDLHPAKGDRTKPRNWLICQLQRDNSPNQETSLTSTSICRHTAINMRPCWNPGIPPERSRGLTQTNNLDQQRDYSKITQLQIPIVLEKRG